MQQHMLKEILISLYLQIIKVLYSLFKPFPQQKKITILVTFEENTLYLYRELEKEVTSSTIVIFCKSSLFNDLKMELPQANIFPMGNFNFLTTLRCLYHLSTSKSVVVDNYYALFSAIKLRDNVECIQIWHAAGAFKTFGLKDNAALKR
ncbi:CDP-glycerol glycerophosphotransferase family protein, partial [Aeromonas veronii]|nr:CDP-glycerol glycerophosphotransferase family protein [Aeromonas veronii]